METIKRQLIVMRHAKSSWKEPGKSDHERPLNRRGRHDAARIAPFLIDQNWTPQRILSSDAQRTRETCELLCRELPDTSVEWLPQFYLAGPDTVRQALQMLGPDDRCVMVLGHNPGWEALVYWLSGDHLTMKTGTVALLEFDSDSWSESVARPAQWSLRSWMHPRDLELDDD